MCKNYICMKDCFHWSPASVRELFPIKYCFSHAVTPWEHEKSQIWLLWIMCKFTYMSNFSLEHDTIMEEDERNLDLQCGCGPITSLHSFPHLVKGTKVWPMVWDASFFDKLGRNIFIVLSTYSQVLVKFPLEFHAKKLWCLCCFFYASERDTSPLVAPKEINDCKLSTFLVPWYFLLFMLLWRPEFNRDGKVALWI